MKVKGLVPKASCEAATAGTTQFDKNPRYLLGFTTRPANRRIQMLRGLFWVGFLLSAFIAAGQTDPAPDLVLSADSISGSGSVGTTFTLPSVSLTSSNSTPIKLSVVPQRSDGAGPNWLVATLTSSTTPATLNISANLQGFVPGTYLGKILVFPLSPTTIGYQ